MMDRKTENSEYLEQASSPSAEAWEMFKVTMQQWQVW